VRLDSFAYQVFIPPFSKADQAFAGYIDLVKIQQIAGESPDYVEIATSAVPTAT